MLNVLKKRPKKAQCLNYLTLSSLVHNNSSLANPVDEIRRLVEDSDIVQYNNQPTDVARRRALPSPFLRHLHPVNTIGDGDCFYRAISFSLFGSQTFFLLIRIAILLDVLENEPGYRHFTTQTRTEDDYERLVYTVSTLGEWAGDAALYAASKILRRAIHLFGEFPNAPIEDEEFMRYMSDPRNRNHRRTLFDNADEIRRPIYIHLRQNHFVALLPTSEMDFPCGSDEYVRYRRFGLQQ